MPWTVMRESGLVAPAYPVMSSVRKVLSFQCELMVP